LLARRSSSSDVIEAIDRGSDESRLFESMSLRIKTSSPSCVGSDES